MKKDNKDINVAKKLLEESISGLNKQFGTGAVGFLKDDTKIDNIDVISTGSLKIDYMTGIKGIPCGRITEIYGHEGSGKTTLALSIVAEAQKAGHNCLYVDMEHALNPKYAQQLGVNPNNLLISQPDSAEQAFEIVEKMIRSCTLGLIVVDSVAALVPQVELDMKFNESLMAGQARLMSMGLRRLAPIINQCKCAVVFINQIRQKVGVMFGSNETTSGGMALRFYSSLRIEVHKRGLIKDGIHVIGQDLSVKIVKNKFASPYVSDLVQLIYGKGFNRYSEMFDLGVKFEFFDKKGSWYALKDGTMVGQGKDACVNKISGDKNLEKQVLDFIESKVSQDLEAAFSNENPSEESEE
jgi:recombination protein RecA